MATSFQSLDDARNMNVRALLREVLLRGPTSRTEIADHFGIGKSTATRTSQVLIEAGLVQELPESPNEGPSRVGRQSRPLAMDPQGGQVLGFAITPTVQTVALADIGLNVIAGSDLKIEPVSDPDYVVRRLAQEGRRLIGAHLRSRARLLGGLVMVTAVLNPDYDSVAEAPYLGWGTYPLRARLTELLNLTIPVRTLTSTVARAEALFGAAQGRRDALALLCGMGVGAAVLIDGNPIGDSRFPVGAIGSMERIGENGKRASLDILAGGLGILPRLFGREVLSGPMSQVDITLHSVIERDQAGDSEVSPHLALAGRELGHLVVQHGHFVRPEIVLIIGPLATAPSYMAAVRETVAEGISPMIEVVSSQVTGPSGGWWASSAMAIYEHLVERPLDFSALGALAH